MKRRIIRWIVVVTLALGATVVWMARDWRSSAAAPLSREELAASFNSDIRNLVVRWDPDDPRPVAEQRAALFTFVHDRRREKRAAAKQGEELVDDMASEVNPLPEPIDGPTDHSAIP